MPKRDKDGVQIQANPLADPKLKKAPGVNIRRARAGVFIYEGLSLKQALISAGYSETTASTPTQHGLTAETCLTEAAKLDKRYDPATILRGSRRLTKRLVDAWNAKPDAALTEKVGALAIPRLVETIERYHGAVKADDTSESRTFVQRAFIVQETLTELRRRGLLKRTENEDSRDTAEPSERIESPRLIGAAVRKGTPLP